MLRGCHTLEFCCRHRVREDLRLFQDIGCKGFIYSPSNWLCPDENFIISLVIVRLEWVHRKDLEHHLASKCWVKLALTFSKNVLFFFLGSSIRIYKTSVKTFNFLKASLFVCLFASSILHILPRLFFQTLKIFWSKTF